MLILVSVASGFMIRTSDGAEHDRMGQARHECLNGGKPNDEREVRREKGTIRLLKCNLTSTIERT